MSTPAEVATSAQALVAALASACIDPSDAVRLLSDLSTFTSDDATSGSVIGMAVGSMQVAMTKLLRRSAVISLARASSSYQPASYDDARTLRLAICEILDAEITTAGDAGEDATYSALRALRQAVVDDLTTRGASLSPMKTFNEAAPVPALVLAQKYYQDLEREDGLVVQANPVHPLFMPTSFRALSR